MSLVSRLPIGLRCMAVLGCAWAGLAMAQQPPKTSSAPTAPAQAAEFRLRVVGGLASLNQYTRLEAPFWTLDLARLSHGRFSADIVPFDRAGIPGIEMLRLLELGVVPFGTVLMSAMATPYPQYTAVDLAGLNPDIATLRASLAAFRPYLEHALREEHGVEVLAIYTYPAQVIFCNRPLKGLADLAGRRTRVSSNSQADFVGALGATPVHTGFAQMMAAMQKETIDCAITGAASGNTMGLHKVTSHLYALPVTWGLAVFGANREAWNSLPPDLRALLQREMPLLEARIWSDSERAAAQGVACSTGARTCPAAQRGAMVLVPVSAQDEHLRNGIFRTTVLPRWLQRCGEGCAQRWQQTIGAARGIPLPAKP